MKEGVILGERRSEKDRLVEGEKRFNNATKRRNYSLVFLLIGLVVVGVGYIIFLQYQNENILLGPAGGGGTPPMPIIPPPPSLKNFLVLDVDLIQSA